MAGQQSKHTLALSFLKQLCRKEQDNFAISPLSLGSALAMLSGGLKGDTLNEILRLFGGVTEASLHMFYSALVSRRDIPLRVANKYLADQDCEFNPEFETLLKKRYEADIECVNFASDAKEIEQNANAWVAKKTRNMVLELLPSGTLNQDSVLVLLNAIHFRGSWFDEFDLLPSLSEFKLRNGEKIQRQFIRKCSTEIAFNETETLRLVKIPYKEASFYMLVLIPLKADDHIEKLIADMTEEDFSSAIEGLDYSVEVCVSMPKFKIEYKFDGVPESLRELGVTKIFDPASGDFSRMFSKVKRSPSVGAIFHKAVIEVDEKGTKAAAATAASIVLCCLPPPPINVVVNRPFCFLIMSADHTICFAGVCAKP